MRWLLISVLAGAGGHLLLKQAASGLNLGVWAAARRGVPAVLLFSLSMLAWLPFLRARPVGQATPFGSLAYVLVMLGGWVFYGEQLRVVHVAGVLLVAVGLLMIGSR